MKNNLPKDDDIYLYPNPFTDNLKLDYKGNYENVNIRIFDYNGREIYKGVIYNESLIDLSMLPTGNYILELNSGDTMIAIKKNN